jgi:hypothetical protein
MGFIRAATFCTLLGGALSNPIKRGESSLLVQRSGWNFLGCYTDNVSGRALPHGVQVPGGTSALTNEACQSACLAAGYIFAGTEYAGECCKQV